MAYTRMREQPDTTLQPQDAAKRSKIQYSYDRYKWMQDNVMGKSWPEFNDRTLKQFLDDSQKRANSYVPSRDAQGKEQWQANVFTGTTRNKVRAYVSSVTKSPPVTRITATNDKDEISVQRGEIMSHLVRHSYIQDNNPEMVIFNDGWNCCVNGTVIKHDGYLKIEGDVDIVDSYDPLTGEVKVSYEKAIIEDRPIEVDISPNNFLIADAHIPNVQDQPEVIWVQYYTRAQFDYEFGNYKDADKVKTKGSVGNGETDLFFGQKWFDRVDEGYIEVIRHYSKHCIEEGKPRSLYRIIANGVLLLDAPLLWGRKKKYYPFAKSVFEPFANSTFFWGNSQPNILMANQDEENTLHNSMLDKTHRTLETPLVIGMENKDAFDLEDEFVTGDTKIYVNDVNQVRPMPIAGVTASELEMLRLVSNGLSLASVDMAQQGFAGQDVTARQTVIANERANEVKGVFFMMLKDLWLQKTRLRTTNILMNYNQPILTKELGREDTETYYKVFNIPKTTLSTGETGTLKIKLGSAKEIMQANKTRGYRRNGQPFNQLDVEEEIARVQEGKPVEIMVIPPDFLDDWEYSQEIETESVYQQGKSFEMAMQNEKLKIIAALFPELFQANKEKFFSQTMRQYGDSPEKYLEAASAAVPAALPGLPPGGAAGGLAGILQQAGGTQAALPALTGI